MFSIDSNDWWISLKMNVINLNVFKQIVEYKTYMLIKNNSWILEDINLCESYSKLLTINSIINEEFDNLVYDIKYVDETNDIFVSGDIDKEFKFVRDSVLTENLCIDNILNFISFTSDIDISSDELDIGCETFNKFDKKCFNECKNINKQLKKLREERSDYLE